MFRKYEKTFRLQTPKLQVPGKLILSDGDTSKLLTGHVDVEEKIDGANVGIIGGKKDKIFRLQKRGSLVDASEHEQFNRFKAWTNERFVNLTKIKYPYVVYGEFMWATHHIFYDNLPDWFICFDVFDGEKYLSREKKESFCKNLEIEVVPLLYSGNITKLEIENLVVGPSAYSTDRLREGIQVKNYKKQMRAKVVNPAFIKEIDEDGVHWMTHWDSSKTNKLKERK